MTDEDRRFPEALGQAENFLSFQEALSHVAKVERSVLLVGERGTGKELAARRLHYLSRRWNGPLIALNCAALSPSLIESELFGYEAGAFTGAGKGRPGRFEAADGGTLFLDEVGLIPMPVQEKILRAVEYGTFERVGSSTPVQVDVRILGATHADLRTLCREGTFKRDLLDRLSFEVLHLPPLRERHEDILLLATHFASRMGHELGREDVPAFDDTVIERLLAHDWPGNIRELKNVIERAVYRAGETVDEVIFDPFAPADKALSTEVQSVSTAKEAQDESLIRREWRIGDVVAKEDGTRLRVYDIHENAGTRCIYIEALTGTEAVLSHATAETETRGNAPISMKGEVAKVERRMLARALGQTQWNQRKAAEWLGLNYNQFRTIYRRHQKIMELLRDNPRLTPDQAQQRLKEEESA